MDDLTKLSDQEFEFRFSRAREEFDRKFQAEVAEARKDEPADDEHAYGVPTDWEEFDRSEVGRAFSRERERRRRAREAEAAAPPPEQPLVFESGPADPNLDTGHYDDGHGFGWQKPPPPAPGEVDTGHYDDGHSFGWSKGKDSARGAPASSRRFPLGVVAAAVAALVAAVVAVVLLTRGDSKPSRQATAQQRPTQTAAPTPTTTAPAATSAAKLTTKTIFWGDSSKIVDTKPGAGCDVSWVYTMRITNGARFAGKQAKVLFYGPDFPGRPTKTFTVGSDGSFTVPLEGHKCFTGAVEGVALVSVGGSTDVFPKPPSG